MEDAVRRCTAASRLAACLARGVVRAVLHPGFDAAARHPPSPAGNVRCRARAAPVPCTASLVLLPGDEEVMIVVTTERETVLLPSAVTAEAELNDLAGRLRAAVDRRADCRDAAEKLHALRVGPAERQLAASGQVDIARLAILACGGLGNLPFAALVRPADG